MTVAGSFWNQSFCIPKPTLTEKNLPDQKGRVFIITGGYAGVGKELAKIIFQRNGTVYVAGRSRSKGDAAIKEITAAFPESQGTLSFLEVDLADLSTIKPAVEDFMKKENRLDVLTNNAGVMNPPLGSLSAQSMEVQMATNCVGPFLFSKLLTPILESTAKLPGTQPGSVRVTWAGSLGVDVISPKGGVTLDNNGAYLPNPKSNEENYGTTKAGNVLLAMEYARRHPFESSKVISNAWNPGNLASELQRYTGTLARMAIGWMLYPAVFGAYTELFAGWGEEAGAKEKNGAYVIPWGRFGSPRPDILKEVGKEGGKAEKFWDWCENVTKEYS
jgi:retinol dehydrogenase 12